MDDYKARLNERFAKGHELEASIIKRMEGVMYE